MRTPTISNTETKPDTNTCGEEFIALGSTMILYDEKALVSVMLVRSENTIDKSKTLLPRPWPGRCLAERHNTELREQ